MERTVIALGFFDGVHIGHGALLRKVVERAKELNATPAVVSFDRPPKEVVTGKPVFLINSADDRREIIQRVYGIERVILEPFDQRMMTMHWQDFITELLIAQHGAIHVVAGHDYHFGYKNEGDPEKLQQKCAELGIGCDIIPRVDLDGITVSSTYIRTLVESGQVERAASYLGHYHTISQTVTHGYQVGRTIGIPTVNFAVPNHVLVPRHGVYGTQVALPDGRSYYGVTNIGTRPTVSTDSTVSVETFLLDFDGDLYDQKLRIDFLHFLRDESRFENLEALKNQIQKDIQHFYQWIKRAEKRAL